MSYTLPTYIKPDFKSAPLAGSPAAHSEPSPADGVAPDNTGLPKTWTTTEAASGCSRRRAGWIAC